MISLLLAQIQVHGGGGGGSYSLGQIALTILIVAGLIAILLVALKGMEIQVPPWLWKILVIVAIVLVAAWAIKIIM